MNNKIVVGIVIGLIAGLILGVFIGVLVISPSGILTSKIANLSPSASPISGTGTNNQVQLLT